MIKYSTIELEKSGRLSSGKPRYLVKDKSMSAVEAALNHYSLKGDRAVRTGNEFWWTMMTLVFWDAFFLPVEGAVKVVINGVEIDLKPGDKKYDKLFVKTVAENGAPADFLTPEFYERRKNKIDETIKELRNLNLERRIVTYFNDNVGTYVTTIGDWAKFPSKIMQMTINHLETEKVLGICERLIANFKENRYGLPDLLVYNDRGVYFVEILDEGESLTPEQIEWHDYLSKGLQLEVEILLVNRDEEEILTIERAFTPAEHSVKISFAHAVGKLTSSEVDIVKEQDSYFCNDDGVERRHGATFNVNEDNIGKIFELLDLTGEWESLKIEYDEEEISQAWLRAGLRCFRFKAKQAAPLDYCKTGDFDKKPNKFGCRAFTFSEVEESVWFEHGQVKASTGEWIFDRQSIRAKVEKEKGRLNICPLFRPDEIDAVIEKIPDRINPREDTGWAFVDRENGVWFWHEERWVSVFGKVKEPAMTNMIGVKKLTPAEYNQGMKYLKDQSKPRAAASLTPIQAKKQAPCFIATAVYGTIECRQVKTLQMFRNRFLIPHMPGRLAVSLYYFLSPPAARLISKFPILGKPIRPILDFLVNRISGMCRDIPFAEK